MIAVQAGFIVGTLASALVNLPDVFSPRLVMTVGITLGVAANGAFALWASSLGPALLLRFATGVCLAVAYPPDGASLARNLARRVRTRPRGRCGRPALRRRGSSPP